MFTSRYRCVWHIMIHILSKGHIIFNTDTSSGLWRFGIESYLGKLDFQKTWANIGMKWIIIGNLSPNRSFSCQVDLLFCHDHPRYVLNSLQEDCYSCCHIRWAFAPVRACHAPKKNNCLNQLIKVKLYIVATSSQY